jgi:hypothetical protein
MNWEWTKEWGQNYRKCKVASAQIRYAAITGARVLQFAELILEPEMQVEKLTEEGVQGGLMPPKFKLTEIGRAIQLPRDYVPPQFLDLQDPVQKRLEQTIRNILDHCAMDALKKGSADIITSATTLRSIIPRGKWTGIEALCSIISGYMCSCAEPFEGTHYIGIGGENLLRAIELHPKFRTWKEYLRAGEVLFSGERGATNNIRWIAVNDISLLKNEGVVFGNHGLLFKEVLTPHLRLSAGAIAWYGKVALKGPNGLHIPEKKRRWA